MLHGNFVILQVLCKAKFDFRKEKNCIFLFNSMGTKKIIDKEKNMYNNSFLQQFTKKLQTNSCCT